MISYKKQIDMLSDVGLSLKEAELRIMALEEKNRQLTIALKQIVDKGPASPGDKKHEIARQALSD